MSKMKKIFAVLLCVAMLMPLLPQPEAKEVEAAESTEIVDDNPNLFTVGGFDAADSLTACSGSATRVTWKDTEDVWGDSQSGCLALPYDTSANTNSYIYYSVAVEPNTKYTISLYTKFDKGGMLQLVAYNGSISADKGLVHQNSSSTITTWEQVAYTFETGEGQTILKIRLGNMGVAEGVSEVATCYLDDLQIRKHEHTSTTTSRTCATKYTKIGGSENTCNEDVLIANGSMSGQESPYEWKMNQGSNNAASLKISEEDANGRRDSQSLRIVQPASQSTNVYTITGTLKGNNTHYRLTWKVKGDTNVQVYPRFQGRNHSDYDTEHRLLNFATTCKDNIWTQGEVLITNINEQQYTLYFYCKGNSITNILLDDVKLVEVEDTHIDGNCDGMCDFATDCCLNQKGNDFSGYHCDKQVIGFAGAQAVLSDEIKLKLYINDDEDENTKLTAKVNNKDVDIELDNGQDKPYIVVSLAAKEMTDVIKAELYLDGILVSGKEYSVQEYAQTILNDSEKASEWDMVKAMLNYGAWAQTYFDYKKTDLANSIVPEQDRYTNSDASEKFASYMTGNTKIVKNGISELKYGSEEAKSCMSFSEDGSGKYGETWSITGIKSSSYVVWLTDTVSQDLADTYVISYWIKTEANDTGSALQVKPTVRWWGTTEKGAYDYFDATETITTSTGWRKVVLRWTRPTKCDKEFRVGIFPKLDNGDSVSIAGFKLERADNTASIKDYEPTIENKVDSFLGYTMVLEDTTSVRLYFNAEPTNAKIDNDNAVIQTKGSKYYIEIPDVKAGELANSHTIEVTSGEQTMKITNFSVLSAATAAIQNDDTMDELKNLCTALVLYAEAAKAL